MAQGARWNVGYLSGEGKGGSEQNPETPECWLHTGPAWAPAYLSSLGQHNNPGSSPVRILISWMQKLRQREGSSLPRVTRKKMAELGFDPRKVDYWAVLETSP